MCGSDWATYTRTILFHRLNTSIGSQKPSPVSAHPKLDKMTEVVLDHFRSFKAGAWSIWSPTPRVQWRGDFPGAPLASYRSALSLTVHPPISLLDHECHFPTNRNLHSKFGAQLCGQKSDAELANPHLSKLVWPNFSKIIENATKYQRKIQEFRCFLHFRDSNLFSLQSTVRLTHVSWYSLNTEIPFWR